MRVILLHGRGIEYMQCRTLVLHQFVGASRVGAAPFHNGHPIKTCTLSSLHYSTHHTPNWALKKDDTFICPVSPLVSTYKAHQQRVVPGSRVQYSFRFMWPFENSFFLFFRIYIYFLI